jgi:DNA segregation ATPase FtsK/SpoIIIE-like protein
MLSLPKFKPKEKKVVKTKEQLKKEAEEKKQFQKDKLEFEEKFKRLMLELGLYNKFNRTYWLRIVEKTNYGFYAQLYLSEGLAFTDLQEKIDKLQQCLNCIWIMTTKQLQDYADIKIVNQPLDEDLPYENPKVKPHQMFMGLKFTLNPLINDMNKNQMVMIAGGIGAGKTRFLNMILLSWILGCTPEQVEIYLSDIAKNEFCGFQHIKHVKFYACELEELLIMMKKIKEIIDKRNKIITRCREKGIATNIEEYNKVSKDKLSYVYIVIDEYSVVAPDASDNKIEKEIKQEIIDIIKKVTKIGRSLGIFTVICLQKTSKTELGEASIIKNMSAVRISFRANDRPSSEVIIGDNSAVGLADRYAVYSLNGGANKDYLFSPNITTDMLNEMLEPYLDEKVRINKSKNNKKVFDPNIVEINTKLKEYKGGFEHVDIPKKETKLVALKGGEFVDY